MERLRRVVVNTSLVQLMRSVKVRFCTLIYAWRIQIQIWSWILFRTFLSSSFFFPERKIYQYVFGKPSIFHVHLSIALGLVVSLSVLRQFLASSGFYSSTEDFSRPEILNYYSAPQTAGYTAVLVSAILCQIVTAAANIENISNKKQSST